mgnify:CR=1 FL=1
MSNQIRQAGFLLILTFTLFQPWLAAQNSPSVKKEVDSLNKLFNEVFSTDLAKAEKLAAKALELSVQSGYAFGEATARSNQSASLLKREGHTKSIEAGFAALKIFDKEEKFKNTFEYGITFIRMAKSFHMEKDSIRSKAYTYQAIAVAERIHDQHLLALGHEHLGNIFSNTTLVDSTLHYYNLAKKEFTRTNYIPGLANVANNTGAMYSDLGNHTEAIKYFREALSIYQKNKVSASFTTGFYNMGFTYYSLKSYSNALHYIDSADYYAEKFKRPTSLLKAYLLKAELYRHLGNVDSSALYYEKSIALKDSIQSDTYTKELAALQTQSDVYKKETENQLLSKDKRIAVLYRNLAIAGIVALVVILGFILLNQRLRIQRRVKNQLEEEVTLRTQEIFHQKETIFHTNLRLKLALNGAKFDSHFAVNVLNAIQQEILQQDSLEAQVHLAKLAHLMQYMLEKSPLERVPLHEEVQMIEQYIQLEQLRLNHRFNYSIDILADKQLTIPALLLQPYVENAIQNGLVPATGEDLHLQLQITASDDVFTIVITDNGADRRKEKSHNQNPLANTVGQERLDLLTHLTHKNHLASIEHVSHTNGRSAGTRIVLQIPIEAQPVAPELELTKETADYAH